jgi:hypothetical protein
MYHPFALMVLEGEMFVSYKSDIISQVPIIVIAVILSGFAASSWTKRNLRWTLSTTTPSNTTANVNATRELTAE